MLRELLSGAGDLLTINAQVQRNREDIRDLRSEVKELRNEVQKLTLQMEHLTGLVNLLALQIKHFQEQETREREMLRLPLEARIPRA